jgi:molybdate/tungstate transport system ATP-binding protein
LDRHLLFKSRYSTSYDKNKPAYNKQTIIHVTHDYEEAIALADRVAVFEDGRIIQVGNPTNVFCHPKSDFIAKLIGIKNFYRGRLEKSNSVTGRFVLESVDDSIIFYIFVPGKTGEGGLVLRSEDITISNHCHESSAHNLFEGAIKDIETVRNGIEVIVDIGGVDIYSLITEISLKKLKLHINKKVFVSFRANAAKFIKN